MMLTARRRTANTRRLSELQNAYNNLQSLAFGKIARGSLALRGVDTEEMENNARFLEGMGPEQIIVDLAETTAMLKSRRDSDLP